MNAWFPTGRYGRSGWKWNHESPSLEPEDLRKIEFTPSEIDALEAIPPSTPPPSPHRQRIINCGMVPEQDNQMIPKITYSPETEHALGAKLEADPEALAFGVKPKTTTPEAETADLKEGFRPSPPQQQLKRCHPCGWPRGRKAKSTPGGASEPSKTRPRRSARIAKRARSLEVAAMQTNPAKATRPRKGVPHTPKRPQATSIVGAGSRRGRR